MSASRITKSEKLGNIKASIKGFFGSWAKTLINILDPCCPTPITQMTEEERDALNVADWKGSIIYNTSSNALNFCTGSAWIVVSVPE